MIAKQMGKRAALQRFPKVATVVRHKLRKKANKSTSGVLVVTVVLAPSKFSCANDCAYCPAQPGTARSYLDNEPAVARGKQHQYDAAAQVHSRLNTLHENGHTVQKIEIIVLGGTFSDYPRSYQEEFLRDVYYAANTFPKSLRPKLSLIEEQHVNEQSLYRVVGVSLETRPDRITHHECMRFRRLGCTRVQVGVQHTDDNILQNVNRGHTVSRSVEAIAMLRNYGFKIDLHVMPDLPGATPEDDKAMLETVLTSGDFSPDYLKIYPCLDVEYTKIRVWKQNGTWQPYAERNGGNDILDVCLHAKKHSQYHTRFNRIQRDFCVEKDGVEGYKSDTIAPNFRQLLLQRAQANGIECKCIRCCEPRSDALKSCRVFVDTYKAGEGHERFICLASKDRRTIYGFVRLRTSSHCFKKWAMIRELHVYGNIADIGQRDNEYIQHRGIGKLLMAIAELYAFACGYWKIGVISGVGVRGYYRTLGYTYTIDGHYMTRTLNPLLSFARLIVCIFRLAKYFFT